MTPFLLKPSGKDYIWGGTRLREEFHKDLPQEPLAETWECSTHPDGPSYVASGVFHGITLTEVLKKNPDFLGTSPSVSSSVNLPVLIKFIDARNNLSVQVHPDDDYARREENGQDGKTEMWYVVDAEPGAQLVFGLNRAISADELRQSLELGTIEHYLRRIPVHKDDVFFIPSGTIHAIGSGALIAEIQQNSNLTYRLYDYGRLDKDGKPRELHIEKALDVADLSGSQNPRQPLRVLRYRPGFATESLARCQYFEVSRCLLHSTGVAIPPLPESFRVLLCIEGEGELREVQNPDAANPKAHDGMKNKDHILSFRKGDTIFIPATTPELMLSGKAEFLLTRC
ncbi:MAG: class I mannose-6-phosphate isomerase [Bacteroidaceae bacterium]|nr:class I mannose-6-phosphate isomerase [Bacteroidaceae bacterium]